MKTNRKALEEKLRVNLATHNASESSIQIDKGEEFKMIRVDLVDPNPYQPRRQFSQDTLHDLAASIRDSGLLQPVTVQENGERYQLISGERRWRAHQLLGHKTIKAIVKFNVGPGVMALAALAENMAREDLTDFEAYLGIRQCLDEFKVKVVEIAKQLALRKDEVYRFLSYDELPDYIHDELHVNPELFARSAAADLKRLLKNKSDKPHLPEILRKGWGLLVEGKILQTKLCDYIDRKLREFENPDETVVESVHHLTRDGKKVGSIIWKGQHLTVRLKSEIVNKKIEDELLNFVENLIAEAKSDHETGVDTVGSKENVK